MGLRAWGCVGDGGRDVCGRGRWDDSRAANWLLLEGEGESAGGQGRGVETGADDGIDGGIITKEVDETGEDEVR
jgi:hypothetical protein